MAKNKNINWPEYLAEQKQSGKTIVDFCKEKGIHPNTFYSARKKYEHSNPFIEITVPKEQENRKTIELNRNGYTISVEPGFCEATLKKVLSLLG
jgi:hypothetical protein